MRRSEPISELITPQWRCASGVHALLTSRAASKATSKAVSSATSKTGVSAESKYGSFNLADHVGDLASAVETNRSRLGSYLRAEHNLLQEPVWLEQVHGENLFIAEGRRSGQTQADASYTNKAGVALAIMVADCLPILLCSADGKEIAAIHAGWKGLANGIIEKTIARFQSTEIVAWLGPSIGSCHYEVDVAVKRHFESDIAFTTGVDAEHWQFDLGKEALRQLKLLSVTSTKCDVGCTWCDDRFYSYRRDGVTGRFATLIWISP